MRLEFDANVPRHEQLLKVDANKTPGRKHQKRAGIRAKERAKASRLRNAALKNKKQAAFKAKVRAYWAGEIDQYPAVPGQIR